MEGLGFLSIALLLVLELTFAADSRAPSLVADSPPQLVAPTPYSGFPDSAPPISPVTVASPPAPYPSNLDQGKSPASSLAPSANDASNINNSDINADGNEEITVGDGGVTGGKKAGIVVAVVVAACLVGFGGLVYKKRRDNIRRSQYGYTARTEIL
ncbi:uncharacterized protein LOC111302189 [Durio zibethinus]|uniref:Uncharacterized protein LOC111302189 n=1 Tax=Durio zibethinus TaxID=66656 RepID=A0A6P5ZNE5_DURZI|nr:uncharacterized protein LOC111302189 [Durio zibethinus]